MGFKIIAFLIVLASVGLIGFTGKSLLGSGAFERAITFSGVYAICKPKGYDVVCFLDADSKQGGPSCVPLELAGGSCK